MAADSGRLPEAALTRARIGPHSTQRAAADRRPPRTPEMTPDRDPLPVPPSLLPRQRVLLVLASAILGAVLCVATA